MQKNEAYWELFLQTGLCGAYLCYAQGVKNVSENQGTCYSGNTNKRIGQAFNDPDSKSREDNR